MALSAKRGTRIWPMGHWRRQVPGQLLEAVCVTCAGLPGGIGLSGLRATQPLRRLLLATFVHETLAEQIAL